MTEIAPDSAIKPAATILLLRDAPEFEVLMVKRHHQIDFASGALVFPGGKSHERDHADAWSQFALGFGDFDEGQRPLRIAAIREVFATKPKEFDPRKYLAPARKAVKELVRHKLRNVLCCAGHAFD